MGRSLDKTLKMLYDQKESADLVWDKVFADVQKGLIDQTSIACAVSTCNLTEESLDAELNKDFRDYIANRIIEKCCPTYKKKKKDVDRSATMSNEEFERLFVDPYRQKL